MRRVEMESVLRGWDYVAFGVLSAIQLAALAWFFWYWFSLPLEPVGWVVTVLLLYGLSIPFVGWLLLPLMRRPRPMPAAPGWKVGVATTFVAGAEPLEMLEHTLRALVAMPYPHDTWVLDESDDEQAQALCARLGVLHFTRKHLPQYQAGSGSFRAGTKHGNYNAWLHEVAHARYDVVLGFDPDHVPAPDYLHNVLGYFDDPAIGYVQVAQVYYNQEASFIARGAAEESYDYYSIGQMVSYAGGYPIVTGSHQCHRVAALREVGGFPVHDAEDLLITLLYRTTGWRGVYVPQVLAQGLTPVNWTDYLGQQMRWARSVMDIKFRQFPRLAARLPRKERVLGMLHGFHFLHVLWMGVALLLIMYLLVTGANPAFVSFTTALHMAGLFAALLPGRFFRQRFYLDPARERGLHLRARFLRMAKWPYFLLALGDVLRGRQVAYALTSKVKASGRRSLLLWPHLTTAAAVGAAWIVGVAAGHVIHPLLHLAAAAAVLLSLGVAWTGTWRFPAPFDLELLHRRFGGGDACAACATHHSRHAAATLARSRTDGPDPPAGVPTASGKQATPTV